MNLRDYRTAGYIIAADIGTKQDYTAVATLEKRLHMDDTSRKPAYILKRLVRFDLGTDYRTIIDGIVRECNHRLFKGHEIRLVVDQTGVGEGILALLRERRAAPIGIVITGGEQPTKTKDGWNVPKKSLVFALELVVESGRLRLPPNLKNLDILKNEMVNFVVDTSESGKATFGAKTESIHDDAVLAVSLGIWYGERQVFWKFADIKKWCFGKPMNLTGEEPEEIDVRTGITLKREINSPTDSYDRRETWWKKQL